jgi:hypothetical protein
MNRLLILATTIAVLYSTSLQAQNLIPYRKGDKWGYCDWDKQILLKPKYQETSLFLNKGTIAVVKKNGKLGLINQAFEEIIKPKYQAIEQIFNSRFLRVQRKNKWALVNATGEILTRSKYQSISTSFFDKYFLVKKQANGVQLYGLIDHKGNEITRIKYHKIEPFSPYGKVSFFRLTQEKKQGVFDAEAQRISIPIIYDEVSLLSKYSKVFILVNRQGKKIKVGACNSTHRLLVPVKYDKIAFLGGHFVVYKNKKAGCYRESSSKLVIPPMYDNLHPVYQNKQFYYQVLLNGKVALVNEQNKIVKPWAKEKYIQPKSLVFPNNNKRYDTGEEFIEYPALVPHQYDKGGKWGFVKEGLTVIPHKYDEVKGFEGSLPLTKVKYKGKWGYINKQGVEYFDD